VKLPRNASGADVIAALERLGFERKRQTGSHVQLSKGPLRVTVPWHNPIAPGTLRSILRQTGLDLEIFLKHLH
jgi:predicted RNA binding protein YcfA (HicA-like mRNA interferase family)